jgi:hypothetical protein
MFSGELANLPANWMFRICGDARPAPAQDHAGETVAIWGYRELVEDENHYPELTEWVPEALAIFREYLRPASDLRSE